MRLKQYENEIADLKARCDAMTFDTARRMEDNEVRIIPLSYFINSFSFYSSLFKSSIMIWKNKLPLSNVNWKMKHYYVLI